MRRVVLLLVGFALLALALWPDKVDAVPYFARQYGVECSMCHVSPPKLNQFGEDFFARGYRMPDGWKVSRRTWPFAVWATGRGQWALTSDQARGLVNRVEIISGGRIGQTGASYFLEWLPVSQEVGSDGGRVARHGRFEDIFINLPAGPVTVTVGQYRMLSQVDVSRRLSISEPLAFSAGLAGPPALSSRLTSLRSFSLSGRAPAVRVAHHHAAGRRAADGLYTSATLPFGGEFVIPLTERVRRERNFEFELRPKGVLLEGFYRHGLSSLGAHTFLGDQRRMIGAVGVYHRGPLFSTLALGYGRERSGATDTRLSWENELIPRPWLALGLRLDDRTGPGRPLAVIPYGNLQFPLTQYTLRLIAEYRQQKDNRGLLLEAGVVF